MRKAQPSSTKIQPGEMRVEWILHDMYISLGITVGIFLRVLQNPHDGSNALVWFGQMFTPPIRSLTNTQGFPTRVYGQPLCGILMSVWPSKMRSVEMIFDVFPTWVGAPGEFIGVEF